MLNDQPLGGVVEQDFTLFVTIVQPDQDAAVGAPQHLPQRLVGMAAALGALRRAVDIVDALDVKRHIAAALKDRERSLSFRCDAFHMDCLDNHSGRLSLTLTF